MSCYGMGWDGMWCCAWCDRYIKYFSRYDGHDKSIKFAGKQRESAMARMAVMMNEAREGRSGGAAFVDVE